jgi:hypothetical protein
VKKEKSDFNKLFSIFYWETQNIAYDGFARGTALEEIFQSKKATPAGYSEFMTSMLDRVGVRFFKFRLYFCHSKGGRIGILDPPKVPQPGHRAVVIIVNGNKWLCEPTWASGAVIENTTIFVRKYNPGYFLRPLITTYNSHFPMDDCRQYLDY